ncbi:hypothetical protein [Flagellimonas meishanensis]|uniref:hypothetical protein n=1 Tax=Flagellimonas meishanensis TaxID=2873264 RepID=UPI001CA63F2C|nr:hypothetical protein [[Muricauda] meishanensis]
MLRKRNLVIILALVFANCHVQQEQRKVDFVRTALFNGQLRFNQNAGTQDVPLLVEEFIIDGGQRLPEIDFPFEGLLIIQLRGGELTTLENNKTIKRDVNEFWVVPGNGPLQINTSDDSAIIRTYLLGKEFLEMNQERSAIVNEQKGPYSYSEIAKNLFAKEFQVFGTDNGPIIRFIDFNIGPGRITEGITLPGAVQIQVVSGGNDLVVNNNRLDKGLGATMAIPEGEQIIVDNRKGIKPVKLRAVIFLK